MGIQEDAEAAYAKTLAAEQERAQAANESAKRKFDESEVELRAKIGQWETEMGYPGQALITDVRRPPNVSPPYNAIEALFSIDELHFSATLIHSTFRVTLVGSTGDEITNLESLGKAMAEVAAANRRSRDW